MQLISGFVDTYLKLNQIEEIEFQEKVSTFSKSEQETVMQITTSWMEEGIEVGKQQGKQEEFERGVNREKELIIRLIKRKLGEISPELETQVKALNIDDVEVLGETLFDFNTVEDLTNWLSYQK